MTFECVREEDVLDAIASNRWPLRCDEALRTHVRNCAVCTDLAEVADAFVRDRDGAWSQARVPSAGVVWWRAQLRAREDAARAAGRPVAFIQGIAASVAVWLAVALFRALPTGYFAEWRTWFAHILPTAKGTMTDFARVTSALPLAIVVIVGASLVLASFAIYVAVADE